MNETRETSLVLDVYVRPFYQKEFHNVASSGLYCHVQGRPPVLKSENQVPNTVNQLIKKSESFFCYEYFTSITLS